MIRVDEALNFHVLVRYQPNELVDVAFCFLLMLVVSDFDCHGHEIIAHLNGFGIHDIVFVGGVGFYRVDEFLDLHEAWEVLCEELGASRVDFGSFKRAFLDDSVGT